MKLKTNVKDFDTLEVGKKSKINEKNLSKAFGILSSMYKNKYRSIIREYTSNALDANIEAGYKDKPVLVKFEKDEYDNIYLKISDYGKGINPKFAEEVYFNYLDTTRDQSNEFLGAYGIGAKCGLSYTSMFHVVSRVQEEDGVHEYKYSFYFNNTAEPEHQLMSDKIVNDKPTGTTIIIKIKNSDYSQFVHEAINTLQFLKNVIVMDIFGENKLENINLYEFKNFKVTSKSSSPSILLNNIPYSLDKEELGTSQAEFIPNIALTFNNGELIPTPSRESFYYTKESVKLIKDKLEAARKEIQDKVWKDSLITEKEDYFKCKNLGEVINHLKLSDSDTLYIKGYIPNIRTKFKPFEDIIGDLTINVILYYPNHMIRYGSNSSFRPGLLCIEGKPKPGTIKYRYLRENRNVNFINKVSYNLHDYKLTFNLEKIPKNKWRKLIQKHQELEDELLKDMVHIDDFKVPDEWVKENRWKWTPASPNRSTSTITYKKDGEIPMKEVVVGDRDPFIWETSYLSANDIKREFIVYGDKDDKDVLKDIKAMLYKRHVGIKVCLLSKRNISYIKHKNNFISTDEFFVKFEKYIRKLVTAHIVNEEFFRKTEFKDRTNIGRMWFYRNSISYRLVSYISNHYVSWFNPTLRKLIVEYEKSSNLDYDVLSDLAKFKNFRDSYYKIIGFNINSHSTGESEIYAFIESLKRHFYNIHKRGKMFFPNLKIDYKLYCKK